MNAINHKRAPTNTTLSSSLFLATITHFSNFYRDCTYKIYKAGKKYAA